MNSKVDMIITTIAAAIALSGVMGCARSNDQSVVLHTSPLTTHTTITPVSVTTNPADNYFGPISLIDSSGLSGVPGVGEDSIKTTTNDTNAVGMWVTRNFTKINTESVTFDLGAAFDLSGTYVWPYNRGGYQSEGVQSFTIDICRDGSNFESLPGTFTLALASGGPAEPAQFLPFSISGARKVRFNILGSFSVPDGNAAAQTGLSEVRFQTVTADPLLKISYTLKSASRVSINIYNAQSKIVRELVHGAARPAGKTTETWDGRDDDGKPLPTGSSYTWKMLSTPGFTAEYLMSPGASYAPDSQDKFWAQAPGSHRGPWAVATDASGVYVGAFTENIETMLLKQTIDGKTRLWSARHAIPWTGPTSLGVAAGFLWTSSTDPGEYQGQIFRYSVADGSRSSTILSSLFNNELATDMAVDGNNIVLAYPGQGVVRWLDYNGNLVRTVSVANATTVDLASDGTAYVIAGTNLMRIGVTATVATMFAINLVTPRRAAVHPGNGDIYVVENAPSQRIKIFRNTGTLKATYGVNGGRMDGLYQNQVGSFRDVTDIAVNSAGDFWVTESSAPRRTARFDATGKWLSEQYGGQVWAPWIVAEPDNAAFVWMASSYDDMMRLQLNYTTKTWSVHSCYRYAQLANGLVPGHLGADVWRAHMHSSAGQNTLYLSSALSQANNPLVVLKVDRTNWKLIPASIVGDINTTFPTWLTSLAASNSPASNSFSWSDNNGDGKVLTGNSPQLNELQLFPANGTAKAGPAIADDQLNYIFHSNSPNNKISRLSPTWSPTNDLSYNTFPGGAFPFDVPTGYSDAGPFDYRYSSYLTTDSAGRLWGAFDGTLLSGRVSLHPFIARYNADSTLAWSVGRAGGTPGALRATRHVFGTINNCIVFNPFSEEWPTEGVTPVYAYNEDGLYAGQLLAQPANPNDRSWRYGLGGEALAGSINKHTDGNVYLFAHWINEGRVYKITGWDNWATGSGSIGVPAGYSAPAFIREAVGPNGAGTGLTGRYYTNYFWTDPPARAPQIDSTLDFVWNAKGDPVGSPVGQINYSVRWTGNLTPRRTGWHMFRQSRGGGLTDDYRVNGIEFRDFESSARAIFLTAGQKYPIKIDYSTNYQNSDINGVLLEWSEPECNGVFRTIPMTQLSP